MKEIIPVIVSLCFALLLWLINNDFHILIKIIGFILFTITIIIALIELRKKNK